MQVDGPASASTMRIPLARLVPIQDHCGSTDAASERSAFLLARQSLVNASEPFCSFRQNPSAGAPFEQVRQWMT